MTALERSVIQNVTPDSPDRVGVIATASMPARSRSTRRTAAAHARALVTPGYFPRVDNPHPKPDRSRRR
jgi:hypothetical protein